MSWGKYQTTDETVEKLAKQEEENTALSGATWPQRTSFNDASFVNVLAIKEYRYT